MKAPALIITALLLIALILLLVALGNQPDKTQTESPVQSTEATLSDRLRFPEGYHLADAYSYAFQVTGPFVVYICQSNDDPTDYRICTPVVVKP